MELLKSENNKLIAKIEELTAYSGRQTLLTDKQTLLNLLVFLVEEAPFGVLVKKVKARSIVYYNKAVTELFQLTERGCWVPIGIISSLRSGYEK